MSSSPDLQVEVRPFVPGAVAAGRAGGSGRDGGGRSEGFVTGYATGYSEGLRRATAAVAQQEAARAAAAQQEQELARTRLTDLMLSLRAGTVQLQEDAAHQVQELAEVVARCAAHLARQVVLDAAPTPEALLARVRRGLAESPHATGTTVSLAPEGVRALERSGVLPDGLPDGVVVVTDARLSVGDVVVRAGATTVTDLLREAVETAVTTMCEDPA